MRRPIVTKRSTANSNAEKSIRPAMSPQNQHLTQAMLRKPATTTAKQFQTTWCFGKDGQHAGGAGDLELATVFPRDPATLLDLQTHCGASFGKKPLQQSYFRAVNAVAFWTPRSGPPQYDVNLSLRLSSLSFSVSSFVWVYFLSIAFCFTCPLLSTRPRLAPRLLHRFSMVVWFKRPGGSHEGVRRKSFLHGGLVGPPFSGPCLLRGFLPPLLPLLSSPSFSVPLFFVLL